MTEEIDPNPPEDNEEQDAVLPEQEGAQGDDVKTDDAPEEADPS